MSSRCVALNLPDHPLTLRSPSLIVRKGRIKRTLNTTMHPSSISSPSILATNSALSQDGIHSEEANPALRPWPRIRAMGHQLTRPQTLINNPLVKNGNE